jgi:hypothetical protein
MVLKDILAISGEGGLFRFIAQGKNSIIVEHLETGKRLAAHGTAKVSALDDISIFTDGEDMQLSAVYDRIWEKENGQAAIDSKVSGDQLKEYFADIVPEYDRDRVYVSDIKKLISWYNILQKLNLLTLEEEPEATPEGEEAPSAPEGDQNRTGETEAGTTAEEESPETE